MSSAVLIFFSERNPGSIFDKAKLVATPDALNHGIDVGYEWVCLKFQRCPGIGSELEVGASELVHSNVPMNM